jgi:hypothetical protein
MKKRITKVYRIFNPVTNLYYCENDGWDELGTFFTKRPSKDVLIDSADEAIEDSFTYGKNDEIEDEKTPPIVVVMTEIVDSSPVLFIEYLNKRAQRHYLKKMDPSTIVRFRVQKMLPFEATEVV